MPTRLGVVEVRAEQHRDFAAAAHKSQSMFDEQHCEGIGRVGHDGVDRLFVSQQEIL